jgi:hypothetical protein
MPATQYDILIEKRADFSLPLLLTNASGSPFNLSGVTLTGQVRRVFDNALQAVFNYSVLNSGSASVTLSLSSTQTSAIDSSPSFYDIFLDTTSGSERILYGAADIDKNVTQ